MCATFPVPLFFLMMGTEYFADCIKAGRLQRVR